MYNTIAELFADIASAISLDTLAIIALAIIGSVLLLQIFFTFFRFKKLARQCGCDFAKSRARTVRLITWSLGLLTIALCAIVGSMTLAPLIVAAIILINLLFMFFQRCSDCIVQLPKPKKEKEEPKEEKQTPVIEPVITKEKPQPKPKPEQRAEPKPEPKPTQKPEPKRAEPIPVAITEHREPIVLPEQERVITAPKPKSTPTPRPRLQTKEAKATVSEKQKPAPKPKPETKPKDETPSVKPMFEKVTALPGTKDKPDSAPARVEAAPTKKVATKPAPTPQPIHEKIVVEDASQLPRHYGEPTVRTWSHVEVIEKPATTITTSSTSSSSSAALSSASVEQVRSIEAKSQVATIHSTSELKAQRESLKAQYTELEQKLTSIRSGKLAALDHDKSHDDSGTKATGFYTDANSFNKTGSG